MQPIVYLISNAVHMYAVYILFTAILGKSKFPKWMEILTYVVYYFINCSVYLFMDNMMLNLISNILPMFIIMLQYRKPIQTYIFLTIGVCAVGMILDWMLFCIFPESMLLKSNTPQSIAFLGLVFLFRHYFNRKEKVVVNSGYVIFLIIISIGTIIIAELSGPEFNSKCFIISVILLIINFLNFYLYDKYIENMQLKIMFNSIETSNQAYQNQIKLMSESQEKIRLLKHDMKNHFLKIRYDIENNKYKEAIAHINRMVNSISAEKEYVQTGNMDFDCFLNYKLSIAEKMGVQFECEAVLPEQLIIDSFDLTAIFGNLLDNAINALEKASPKLLKIDINYSIGIIVIKIANTFNERKDTELSDSEEHGYGLVSVEKSVSKYNGKIDCGIIDNMYVAKAVLCNIVRKS